ncbi:MAG: HEAT repeat domain-containing protein, partial [Polyangiaceae bacterium]
MEVLLLFALVALVVWLSAKHWAGVMEQRQHDQREWLAAAEALQLKASGGEDRRSIAGQIRGVPAHVTFVRERRGVGKSSRVVEATTFVAGGDGRIPRSLTLTEGAPEGFIAGLIAGIDDPGATTGDEEFDSRVGLPNMNAHVCAALSEKAREQLTTFVHGGGRVARGAVQWPLEGVEHPDRQWLIDRIEDVVTLAELLSVTTDTLAQRLAHNATHDSDPDVRLRNLSFLVASETHAPRELIATTARALLDDPLRPIRFHSARQLGSEGHATLRGLTTDEHAAPALRAQALGALHEGNAADIDQWLAPFLTPSPLELTRAALGVVAARRLSIHTDRVIALTSAADASLRVAAARTLSMLESAQVEPALLRLLADEESEVQTATAEALGSVGSVSA